MSAVCAECKVDGDHQLFVGDKPDFARGYNYAICESCGSVFNVVNPLAGDISNIREICETLLSETRIKLCCYVFGPGSAGADNAFDYEYKKRLQLRESLPT